MDDAILWILVLFTALIVAARFRFSKIKHEYKGKTIPGPALFEGLTVFIKGMLNNTLHLYLPEWAEKYGDIMQVNLLVKKVIYINNAEVFKHLVKDEYLRDLTNDRPPSFIAKYINGGYKEIIFTSYSPVLQYRRKIFHNILKFYGEGRGRFEELMVATLTKLIENMKLKENVKLTVYIRNYILSLIGFLLTGDISETADANLKKLQAFSDDSDNIVTFENETMLQAFPLLRFIPGLRFKWLYDALLLTRKQLHETYFYSMKKTFDSKNKRDIVDELISTPREIGSGAVLDDATIKALVQTVVGAAYLTSTSTLTSLFLFLIKHQDIQDRVYEEKKNVIGESTPSFKHRQHMPFTEAVILETLRLSSNVPLLIAHFTKEDIVFDGYFIPKATTLMMNAWHNHHREDFWKDPWAFRPDRFLDANGQLLELDHPVRRRLISFGAGRRQCPGETFAKSRVFLITTFLLKRFQFLPDDSESFPSTNPADWSGKAIISPNPYTCKIKLRCI